MGLAIGQQRRYSLTFFSLQLTILSLTTFIFLILFYFSRAPFLKVTHLLLHARHQSIGRAGQVSKASIQRICIQGIKEWKDCSQS